MGRGMLKGERTFKIVGGSLKLREEVPDVNPRKEAAMTAIKWIVRLFIWGMAGLGMWFAYEMLKAKGYL